MNQRQSSAEIDELWDVAILGGGVIGLACAFELARRRRRVVLIERGQPGQHASRVAAGLLGTAALPLGDQDDLFPLKLDSLRRYPQFIAKVESIGRMSAGYRVNGTLWVSRNAEEDDQLEQLLQERTQRQLRSKRVTAHEIGLLEPELSADLVGGLLVEEDVQVDPRHLLAALQQALSAVRVKLLSQREATSGEYDESAQAWEIQLRSQTEPEHCESLRARNVLVTAGPWCDQIVDAASEATSPLSPTGVGPVKGQLLRLRGPRMIGRVIRTTNIDLAQRRDGELIVASTKEPEAGWDLTPTESAREELLSRASGLISHLRELDLDEHSVGLRPAVGDHLPIIGPAGRPGLWIATGHYRHGILLAPGTAYWLAEAMESGQTADQIPVQIAPYGLERLGTPRSNSEATA